MPWVDWSNTLYFRGVRENTSHLAKNFGKALADARGARLLGTAGTQSAVLSLRCGVPGGVTQAPASSV